MFQRREGPGIVNSVQWLAYGLDDSGFVSLKREIFLALAALCTKGTGLLSRGKSGRDMKLTTVFHLRTMSSIRLEYLERHAWTVKFCYFEITCPIYFKVSKCYPFFSYTLNFGFSCLNFPSRRSTFHISCIYFIALHCKCYMNKWVCEVSLYATSRAAPNPVLNFA